MTDFWLMLEACSEFPVAGLDAQKNLPEMQDTQV